MTAGQSVRNHFLTSLSASERLGWESGLCRLTLVSTTMFRDNDTSSKCKTLIDIACGGTVQMSEGPVSKARS